MLPEGYRQRCEAARGSARCAYLCPRFQLSAICDILPVIQSSTEHSEADILPCRS